MQSYSDVYICYHPESGQDLALLVEMQLKQREFSVFMDYHANAEEWTQQMREQLAHAADIILVVTAGTLENCMDTNSRLCREMLEARRLGANVITVFKYGSRVPEDLPEELSETVYLQCVTFMPERAVASMDALYRLMKSRPSGQANSSGGAQTAPNPPNAETKTNIYNSFGGCTSLTSVTIPNSVTKIDYCAFYNCKSLKTLIIPDSVTNIGESAFRKCPSLKNVTLPDSVKNIGDSAFADCSSLTISIPKNCSYRGYISSSRNDNSIYSFYKCKDVTQRA